MSKFVDKILSIRTTLHVICFCTHHENVKCKKRLEKMYKILKPVFEKNEIDNIVYQVLHNTDRTTIKKEFSNVDVFINDFREKELKLKVYDFIAEKIAF